MEQVVCILSPAPNDDSRKQAGFVPALLSLIYIVRAQ